MLTWVTSFLFGTSITDTVPALTFDVKIFLPSLVIAKKCVEVEARAAAPVQPIVSPRAVVNAYDTGTSEPTAHEPLLDALMAQTSPFVEQLEEALETQVVYGGSFGTNLCELGFLKEVDLARALGQHHGLPYASGEMVPDPNAVALAEKQFLDYNEVMPMRIDATRLTVAVLGPHQIEAVDALTGCRKSGLRRRHRVWRPARQIARIRSDDHRRKAWSKIPRPRRSVHAPDSGLPGRP